MSGGMFSCEIGSRVPSLATRADDVQNTLAIVGYGHACV
jgi:hypothetical protein